MIITSISPSHSNIHIQQKAIDSWQSLGIKCFSLNTIQEINKIGSSTYNGIELLETTKTTEHLFNKTRVNINAFIDIAKAHSADLLLINSDIILDSVPEFKKDGITILSRYDYVDSFDDVKRFGYGFDVFYIPNRFLNIFPPSVYSLGAAFFDLWIPYRAILNNVIVYYLQGQHAFHKIHSTQYSADEWNYIAEYVKWEFKFDKRITGGQVATMMMNEIQSKLIYI